MKKISLCQSCAQDPEIIKKEGLEQMLNLPDIPTAQSPSASAPKPDTSAATTAPAPPTPDLPPCECGFTYDDLVRTGRLGCPLCYDLFADLLRERIESIHRGTTHTGKMIDVAQDSAQLQRRLNKLEQELSTAISQENFEKAAELKPQIDALKTQLSS